MSRGLCVKKLGFETLSFKGEDLTLGRGAVWFVKKSLNLILFFQLN